MTGEGGDAAPDLSTSGNRWVYKYGEAVVHQLERHESAVEILRRENAALDKRLAVLQKELTLRMGIIVSIQLAIQGAYLLFKTIGAGG